MMRRPVAAAAVLLLLLSGCATGGASPDDDLLPVEVGDPDDDLLPVEVDDPDDDLLPVVVGVGGRECLPGAWLLDNASWREVIATQAAAQGSTVETPTGSVVLTFAEGGGYTVDYASWEIRMSTADGTAIMRRAGRDAGSYTASSTDVMLSESESGSVAQGTVETSSGSFPLPPSSTQSAFVETFGYACENDDLTATIPEGRLRLTRVS
jgi:hypothetical protein